MDPTAADRFGRIDERALGRYSGEYARSCVCRGRPSGTEARLAAADGSNLLHARPELSFVDRPLSRIDLELDAPVQSERMVVQGAARRIGFSVTARRDRDVEEPHDQPGGQRLYRACAAGGPIDGSASREGPRRAAIAVTNRLHALARAASIDLIATPRPTSTAWRQHR